MFWRAAEYEYLSGLPGIARCAAGAEQAVRWNLRCWPRRRLIARFASAPFSRERTTSIPTGPKTIKSRSSTSHWPSMAGSMSDHQSRNGDEKRIGITRLHMEEDAGKSMHDGFPGVGDQDLCSPEPLRHAPDRDCKRARYPHARRGL